MYKTKEINIGHGKGKLASINEKLVNLQYYAFFEINSDCNLR